MNTSPLKKSWTSRPLPQMVYTRLIEFTREPQAVFWVYFFPLLMAFSLGIAFREKPTEVLKVCLVGNPLPNSPGRLGLLIVPCPNSVPAFGQGTEKRSTGSFPERFEGRGGPA